LVSIAESPDANSIINQFNRDTVFFVLILTLTAYFVNKYHSFIMAGIYVLFLLIYSLLKTPILLEGSITIMFAVVAYSFIIYFFVKLQERTQDELNEINNHVMQQNEELTQQQEEITSQRDELSRQKKILESRNTEILDGIRFAKSIQESVLSKESDIAKFFTQYFVISKPKTVISGDFFWVKEWKGNLYISVVDCTGHGVPGALVSMLANMYLGRVFIEIEDPSPANILNYISNAIAKELRLVDNFHSRIGMDIACICINSEKSKMEYAAAFSPLYRIRRDNLTQFEPTKLMIGLATEEKLEYKNEEISLKKGDRFYLFSDGLTDQFGGSLDKKFGYKRFKNALVDTNHESIEVQRELFRKKWLNWKSDRTQTDDVLLIGIEI
jgi:serine phosphatase RsbU (regulator of sigma subunit)